MPYVKPVTFVTATSLNAADVNSNDDALREWINEGSVSGDLAADAFNTEEIALGEYQPITNEYYLQTGIDTGAAIGTDVVDRAYFTSHTKKSRQTDPALEIWQSLYTTGPCITLERTADVIITFGGAFVSSQNSIVVNGFWDSELKLAYIYNDVQALTFVNQARSYTFEEALMTATVSGSNDPFGAMPKPSSGLGVESPEITKGLRRWIGWTAILTSLPAGTYKFSYYVDPKVEKGFLSARNFKAEVFYK